MKSKAAVLFEPGRRLELHDIEVQPPKAGEALVRIAAAGVCHSDLHVMTGHLFAPLPAVLGHEGAGIVEDTGPGVISLHPGDHVIPLWRMSCGECEYCTGGRPALCPEGTAVRMTGHLPDGTTRLMLGDTPLKHFAGVSSFSQYAVIPERALLKIPDDLPLDRAALFGCAVITGVGAVVNAARVRAGSAVAVFGAGGIGLNALQGARLAGAVTIIAVDIVGRKLEYARDFGATHTIDASTEDPVARVRSITAGRGVDYAFEAIGIPHVMRQAYDSLAKRGVAVIVGVTPMTAEIAVPIMPLVFEERVLTGSVYGSSRPRIDIPKLIALYRAGRLKLDELLTRSYPFEEINAAYDALERGEVARSVVTF
jgi:NDMA-dependent alcohol dehydrogenase